MVAWHDGDHDELQRADALRVLIDVADGRLSVADATGLIGVRLGARRVRRHRECHLYFCTPSDISSLRRQLRRMSGGYGHRPSRNYRNRIIDSQAFQPVSGCEM